MREESWFKLFCCRQGLCVKGGFKNPARAEKRQFSFDSVHGYRWGGGGRWRGGYGTCVFFLENRVCKLRGRSARTPLVLAGDRPGERARLWWGGTYNPSASLTLFHPCEFMAIAFFVCGTRFRVVRQYFPFFF